MNGNNGINEEDQPGQTLRKVASVEIALPKIKMEDITDERFVSKGKMNETLQIFTASIDEVSAWFKQYHVESIELWISGVIETGGVPKLFINAKGEAGMKVTLKPKSQ
jgi:hypothetical protein